MHNDLNKTLAEEYTLMLKTQNFHWNVEGPLFFTLHKLFEEQYNTLFSTVDEIAERIRALGFKAPGSYKEFQTLSFIEEAPVNKITAHEMIDMLAKDHTSLSAKLKERREAAEKAGDSTTADVFAGLMEFHDKSAWMIRSHKG